MAAAAMPAVSCPIHLSGGIPGKEAVRRQPEQWHSEYSTNDISQKLKDGRASQKSSLFARTLDRHDSKHARHRT